MVTCHLEERGKVMFGIVTMMMGMLMVVVMRKIRTNMILSFRCGNKQTSPFSAAFGQNAALSALPRLRWSLKFFLSNESFNYRLSKASLSIV